MPGLIETSINKTDPSSSIVGYSPNRIAVNADEDTVAGQLRAIIAGDSPLLQGARTRALQGANARGLLNSSMAAQAGEEALYKAALPIASQDASTYSNARTANEAAANRGLEFTAGATNTTANQVLAGNQQIGAIEATGGQQRQTLAQSGTQDLANIEATGGQQRLGIAETGGQQRETLAQSGAQDISKIAATGTENRQTLAQAGAQETGLQGLKGAQDVALQTLKGQQATSIANIEAEFKGLMQTNSSAATVLAQTQKNITDILNDANTSMEQKQVAVDHQTLLLRNSLAVIGSIGGVNIEDLLEFGTLPSTVKTIQEISDDAAEARRIANDAAGGGDTGPSSGD